MSLSDFKKIGADANILEIDYGKEYFETRAPDDYFKWAFSFSK
jgi:hypothetical protein